LVCDREARSDQAKIITLVPEGLFGEVWLP
jgi:hypothetical protein